MEKKCLLLSTFSTFQAPLTLLTKSALAVIKFFLFRFFDLNQRWQICLNFPEIPIKYIQFPSPWRNWIRSYAEAVTKCSFAIHQIGNPTRSIRDQILIGHFGETDIQHFPTFSRRPTRLKNQFPDLSLT